MSLNVSSAAPTQPVSDAMQLAFRLDAILGEGLQWKPDAAQWWWTDIQASALYCWTPASGASVRYPIHDRVGSFAHCESGKILLGTAKWLCITNGTELTEAPPGNKALAMTQLVAVDPLEARTRVNDGRTDRAGCFVFGTMNEAPEKRPIGSFFQYSKAFGLRRLALPAVAISNSICFSVDGRTMYFADTLTRRIFQCDYDSAAAQVGNVRLFANAADSDQNGVVGYPDGSVIDRDGCLWNAQWGAGRIVHYSPDGEFIRAIAVPVKNPTCPAFGGAQLDQLLVTSSRQEMNAAELTAMPSAGSLFACQLSGPTGIPEVLFRD